MQRKVSDFINRLTAQCFSSVTYFGEFYQKKQRCSRIFTHEHSRVLEINSVCMKQRLVIAAKLNHAVDANSGNLSSRCRLGLKLQYYSFLRPVKERCCTVKDIR